MPEDRWVCQLSGDRNRLAEGFIEAIDKVLILKYRENNVRWISSKDRPEWVELQVRAGIYGNEVIE